MRCEPSLQARKFYLQGQLRRTKCHRNPGNSSRWCCTIQMHSLRHNCRTICSSSAQALVSALALAVLWSALVSVLALAVLWSALWSALVMAGKSAAAVPELSEQESPVEWELALDCHQGTNPLHNRGNLPRSSRTTHPQRNFPRTRGHHSSTLMAVLESAPAWAVGLASVWVQEWSWEAHCMA